MLKNPVLSSFVRRTAVRFLSSQEAVAANVVKLNFCLPHETVYAGATVHSVIIPGSEGDYAISANHVPYIAQLKPGVLQILHEENSSEPEKYFVPGGYALTHPDSSTVSENLHIGQEPFIVRFELIFLFIFFLGHHLP